MSKKHATRRTVKNRKSTVKPRRRDHLFQKGQSGNPKGRPKGSLNHSTADFKKFMREAGSQVDFLEWLLKNLRSGKLRSDLIRTVWAYGHGRPPIAVDLSVDFNPRDYMSRDEEAPDD